MKILLVNGSPNEKGCTHTALCEVKKSLEANGCETEIMWIGKTAAGCMGCGACRKIGKCVQDDAVNIFAEKAKEADGFVFGSAVHYAAISGSMSGFMDRAFFSAGGLLAGKPAASVVSCRRGGASAAFDEMNKYFMINNMPVVSSQYWNQVHGSRPEDVLKDEEGIQTMRTLGNNMAWLVKCIEAGKAAGIAFPPREEPIKTNFIR